MTSLQLALVIAGLPALVATGYLAMLTLLWRKPTLPAPAVRPVRFCVLVPAHNEERGIEATVRSLRSVDYPASLVSIVVVADNCTDRTAEIARAAGARVMERSDAGRRGKGWALRYGIDELLASVDGVVEWDVLVVVDADTDVSPNLLGSLAAHVEAGASAVQVAYLPRRGGHGPLAVITEVALTAFHLVRSGARERLGLSCGLRGNGMAFRRELLRTVPHEAFSRTEDLEFGVLLGLGGVRVAFAGDTVVNGDMPSDTRVATRQRERWIGGRAAIARRFVPALVGHAFRRRSALSADLAMDLVVPPLSVLAVLVAAGVAAASGHAALTGGMTVALWIWITALVCLLVHVIHAAVIAGRLRDLTAVASALPAYAVRKAAIAMRAVRPSEEVWVRTAREGEEHV